MNTKAFTNHIMLHRLVFAPMLVLTLLWCGHPAPLFADVFQSIDEEGVVHLTNVPNNTQYQVMPLSRQHSPVDDTEANKAHRYAVVFPYTTIVEKAARAHDLDQALLLAIIAVESGYDPQATSSEGAAGLMQLMPATALRYGVIDRYDPEENINAGARYLRDLINQFHDNLSLALAAYNAGEDAVVHYGNAIPPFPETRHYVPRVLELYKRYRLNAP